MLMGKTYFLKFYYHFFFFYVDFHIVNFVCFVLYFLQKRMNTKEITVVLKKYCLIQQPRSTKILVYLKFIHGFYHYFKWKSMRRFSVYVASYYIKLCVCGTFPSLPRKRIKSIFFGSYLCVMLYVEGVVPVDQSENIYRKRLCAG